MTYNAKVKLQYINDSEATPSKYFPELVDQMTVTIEAPASDLNVYQYYELFKSFLLSLGFQYYSVMEGACRLAFNDSVDEDVMKKLMEEYELQDKQIHTDAEYEELEEKALKTERELLDLKAKLSRFQQQDNPQYTDEELEAMCNAAQDKESCKEMTQRELEWADRDKKSFTCDKDDKSKECEDAWGKFWNDDNPKPLTYDEMIAEGYEMTADGFWVPSETKFKKWQLIPGSEIAVKAGCKCPVMDNAEMPDDRKWVSGDCPLHGKK